MKEERCGIWHIDDGVSRRPGAAGPDGGCVVMDERRMVVLSSIAVASTAGLARSMRHYLL